MLKRYLNDESGQALSEYGLLIAVVGLGIVGLVIGFRGKIATAFDNAEKGLEKSNTAAN